MSLFWVIVFIIPILLGSLVKAPPVPTIYWICVRSFPWAKVVLPDGPYTYLIVPAWRSMALVTASNVSRSTSWVSSSLSGMGW